MKSHLAATVITTALATLFCTGGYAQQTQKTPTIEQIATWVVEDDWNKGDFRLGDQMMQPTFVLHYQGRDIPLNRQSATQIIENWRNAFPDFHFRIEDMIVQGNKVVLRIPFTGTHMGKFWGLEPTGKKINVTETLILRVEDGKVAEMWEDYDEYGMRIQLGLIQPN